MPAPPPESDRRSGNARARHLPTLLLGVGLVVASADVVGIGAPPFTHVRAAAGVLLLCAALAVLGGGGARRPLHHPAWMRTVAALGLVAVLLGVMAVITGWAESLVGLILLTLLVGVLAVLHRRPVRAGARRGPGPRR